MKKKDYLLFYVLGIVALIFMIRLVFLRPPTSYYGLIESVSSDGEVMTFHLVPGGKPSLPDDEPITAPMSVTESPKGIRISIRKSSENKQEAVTQAELKERYDRLDAGDTLVFTLEKDKKTLRMVILTAFDQ